MLTLSSPICRLLSAHHLIAALLLALSATGVKASTPIMGWSSWNTYRVNISDSLILRQANALVATGLDSVGYRYINIDDGYFGGRDTTTGQLIFHPERFPQGLRTVVEHIHRLGLKAGIYSDAGINTCGNFWDNDSLGQGVGLYGHDDDDCRLFFNELGFDFIKVDFCGGDERQNSTGLSLDPAQRYSEIRQAINRTGRTDVKMNVCRWNYPGTWVRDIASSWRTTADISPSWESVKNIIAENLYLSAYAGKGHHNDMDMLEVGRTLTPEEDRTHFAMWCMMSSPLLIGCDLTTLRPETLKLLKNRDLIALNQDSVGQQAYVAKRHNGTYILVRDVGRVGGLSRAVAFYNPTDHPAHMSIATDDIELTGTIIVRDLINQTDIAPVTDSLVANLPPHGTMVFRLISEKRLPRTLYEAETAFLPSYQELENPIATHTGYYREAPECSGGICAAMLGGNRHNHLIWENVNCNADGIYDITIHSISYLPRNFTISVNGTETPPCHTSGSGNIELSTIRTSLRKGLNSITLKNDSAPMPDIDCMVITPAP